MRKERSPTNGVGVLFNYWFKSPLLRCGFFYLLAMNQPLSLCCIIKISISVKQLSVPGNSAQYENVIRFISSFEVAVKEVPVEYKGTVDAEK